MHPVPALARRTTLLLPILIAGACESTPPDEPASSARAPRILCVQAHPDDEGAYSGTLFKAATHLGAVVDIVVITNGEAGYKYTTLAEVLYRRRLTDPATGRSELPGLRQKEMREAADILHVREVRFLSEQDLRYTQDPNEALGASSIWNLPRVRRELADVLDRGHYDFLLVHLPMPKAHGHHVAASILALEAVRNLPKERRPVPLGAFWRAKERKADDPPPHPFELEGFPLTRQRQDAGPWYFDSTQTFGYEGRLDYRIVKSWVVAAHKTQGVHQRNMGRGELEAFRMFDIEVPDAVEKTDELFCRLGEPQFPPVVYDAAGEVKR